ncbi:signal peptidase I [Rummeliibacillus sp. G93]|uniref:Signal peptidase I n=1 Tax=Rummeliibacillus stabekisii TaxID=241244 RepID=A0A143HEU3_9BACL|nr:MULTISPECIES: signal peptidase I [Rummeliibacillus]AMX00245.1 signal peptidase I [Rummeliibacillus stabekisii]MBB5171440.1 signal peptidase I [Rummeliibacillus stabekisii]MCM3317827.1 signal peptidase I [Rummeliibacillus stabekisii]UQW97167.1 signal peptidase I [Rummeliibacillus sp. G93]GEL05747.1 signal peptidase I [Rummeliibacillus stabekisii]
MEKRNIGKELLSWVWPILLAVIIAVVCRQFLFSPVTVKGESMEPTYHNNNKIIISKVSHIDRFDIIVFDSPVEDDHYIKRVIGLPGDTIKVKDDQLYINGKKYKEPYLKQGIKEYESLGDNFTEDFTLKEVSGVKKVPKNSYFVLGDNRQNSSDSRDYGFIKKSAVTGEVKFQFYPLKF